MSLCAPPDLRSLVVLPTYQEAANIEAVLRRIRAALPDAVILVVDDSSPDGTSGIVEGLATDDRGIRLLRRPAKRGLGSAYRDGFAHGLRASFDVLVEMDADLSHDPADLVRLVQAVADGADLAIGSRYVEGGGTPGWSTRRRLLSRWGNRYAAWALGLDMRDATSGFRAYRRTVVEAIDLEATRADGYAFQIELAGAVHLVGGRIVEVPITFRPRAAGASKMSGRIVAEALWLVTHRAVTRGRPWRELVRRPALDGRTL